MTPSPSQKPITHTIKNIVKNETNVIHMTNGCPIILKNSCPLNDLFTDKPSTTSSETSSWDLTTYENRLRTFMGWNSSLPTSSEMAKAGLYYMGKQDRVRCMFCSKEFDHWRSGDDPCVEHKLKSPQCPFFRESKAFDVCGIYGSLPTINDPNKAAKKIEQFFDSMGIMQRLETPKHKEFIAFETRLKTFDKCEKELKQGIQTFCEAGFYYIGNGQDDQVLCFCCNQGLKDWDDEDEPWTEHARWSPTCSYVLLSKGKSFIDAARGVKNDIPKISQVILSKLVTEHKGISIPGENNIKVNSTNRNHDQPEINLRNKVQRQHQRDPSTMPDSMMCKICYKEELKVAFLPCGHVIACIQCAMTLEHCAVCRRQLSMVMRVYVNMDEDKDEDLEQLPCSSSQCSDEPLDPMLCKVCHKEEMQAAFIPCRHVYACVKCATSMPECPVCSEAFCATVPVYL